MADIMSVRKTPQDAKIKANKELLRDLQAQAQLQQEQAAHTFRSIQRQVTMSTLAAQADRSRQALAVEIARAAQVKEAPASCLYFTFTPHFHQPSHVFRLLQTIALQWYLLAAIEAIPQDILPQNEHVPENLRYDVDPADMRTWDASLLASLVRLAMASKGVRGRVNAMEMLRQSVISRRALGQGMSCITFWDIDSTRKFFEHKKNTDDEKTIQEEVEEKMEAQVGDDADENSDCNDVQDDIHGKSRTRAEEIPSPTKSAQRCVMPTQTLKSNTKLSFQSAGNSPAKTSSPNKSAEDEKTKAETYHYIDLRKRDGSDRNITIDEASAFHRSKIPSRRWGTSSAKLSLRSPNYAASHPDSSDENPDLCALSLSTAIFEEAGTIADEQQSNTDGQKKAKIRNGQQEETEEEQARNSTNSKKRKRRAKSWGQLAFKPSPNKKAKTSSQLPTPLQSVVKSQKTPPPKFSDMTHLTLSIKEIIPPCTPNSSSSSRLDSSLSRGNSSHKQSVTPGTSPTCSQVDWINGTVHYVEEKFLIPSKRSGEICRAALENARAGRKILGDAIEVRNEDGGVEEADSPFNQVSMKYMMQSDRQQPASVEKSFEQHDESKDFEMGFEEADASQHACTKKGDLGRFCMDEGGNQDASEFRSGNAFPTSDSCSNDDVMLDNTSSRSSSDDNRNLDPDYDPDEAQDREHTEQTHENMPLNPIDQTTWHDMAASQGDSLTHLGAWEALEADHGKQQDQNPALGDFRATQVDIRGVGRSAREWHHVVQPEDASSSESSNADIDCINAEYDANRNEESAKTKRFSSISSSNPDIPRINALYDAARGEEPARDVAQYRRRRRSSGSETSSSSSPVYPSAIAHHLQHMSNSRDVRDLADSPSARSNSDEFFPSEAASTREALQQDILHSRIWKRERMGSRHSDRQSLSSPSSEASKTLSASSGVQKARWHRDHRIVKVIRLRPGEVCLIKAARKRGDRK